MNYYSSEQLIFLNNKIAENIEVIASHFDFKIYKDKRFWVGCCPVHDGDNNTALNIYHSGSIIGNWYCRTHLCEKEFSSFPLGFIQGLLSKGLGWPNVNKKATLGDAVEWSGKFLDIGIESSPVKTELTTDYQLSKIINGASEYQEEYKYKITDKQVKDSLDTPSKYFLNRGFKQETLLFYNVGDCNNKDKPMYGRAVVPIYDPQGKFIVGCSGRALYNRCKLCRTYHSPDRICPSQDYRKLYGKWKHSSGFSSSKILYNYHNALESIRETNKVIIVEGFSSVWKLKEAGFDNAVATCGIFFNDFKKKLLDKTGALDILVIRDAGEAGERLLTSITEHCNSTYNIVAPEIEYDDDIGACSTEFIKEYMRKNEN